MTPDVQDIRDIRGPIEIAAHSSWWPYAIAASALVLIALAMFAYRKRRKTNLAPDRRALAELAHARGQLRAGDPHRFSIQVSEAVRTYVEAAFALHAPRWTTEELLAELMSDQSPVAAHRHELGRFLEAVDRAKYARIAPSFVEMVQMLETAEAFVRTTAAAKGSSS
ncbi:MAG: DUF4381 family protein [Kofleriaceae bacterium]